MKDKRQSNFSKVMREYLYELKVGKDALNETQKACTTQKILVNWQMSMLTKKKSKPRTGEKYLQHIEPKEISYLQFIYF